MNLSVFDESKALGFYLFEGCEMSSGDRKIEDKIKTARTEKSCNNCREPVAIGTRYRCHAGVYDGEMRRYAFCTACCVAMTADDPLVAIEARYKQ